MFRSLSRIALATGVAGAASTALAQPCNPEWSLDVGSPGPDGLIHALAVWDEGTGPALYAGGAFTQIGALPASRLAKWDGHTWSAVGTGTNGPVAALVVYDDGGGPALFLGGEFTLAGGAPAQNIAKWNGNAFTSLGAGVQSADGAFGAAPLYHPAVDDMVVYDDGGGPALVVGGDFTRAGSVTVQGIAKWRGGTWAAFAGGLRHLVNGMKVHDDGGGPALFVGGSIVQVNPFSGPVTGYMARWRNGWGTCNGGMTSQVLAFETHNDGTGTKLYAAGLFGHAGGVAAENIARWNGQSWAPVGPGLAFSNFVYDLRSFDDGLGSQLYAGGNRFLKRWSGSAWGDVGGGPTGPTVEYTWRVRALGIVDNGSYPNLYVAGDFTGVKKTPSAPNTPVNGIARWGCPWLRGDLDCSQSVDFFDIDAFVLALSGPAAYSAQYPNCAYSNADCNRDGVVDFFDIDAFVARLGE